MKKVDIKELVDAGEVVRIGKNQIFKDNDLYVVEKYEFTETNGDDMFSVHDGYKKITDAIRIAATI